MSGEFFFMALGGLGVSLAGFAGLIYAFVRKEGETSPFQSWRIANIVVGGAILTITGFGAIAIFILTNDEENTVRITSGVFAILLGYRFALALYPGPAWAGYERRRRGYMIVAFAITTAAVVNVFVGHVGFLAVLMVVYLLEVFGIFTNAVLHFTTDAFQSSEDDP